MTNQEMVDEIMGEVARRARSDVALRVDTLLADIGIDSIGIINLLADLEASIGLDIDRITQNGPPKTLGEILAAAAPVPPVAAS